MSRLIHETVTGWKEARWSLDFAMLLLPLTLAATGVAYVIEGGVQSPPTPLAMGLTGLASLVSLYWAGLKDGPDGRLGRWVWTLTVVLFVLWLIKTLIKKQEGETAELKLAGHNVIIHLRGRVEGVWQIRPRWTDGETEPKRVLIGA
jgi:hypothetical protein